VPVIAHAFSDTLDFLLIYLGKYRGMHWSCFRWGVSRALESFHLPLRFPESAPLSVHECFYGLVSFNRAARPGLELPAMSGPSNQRQPQEDQNSEKTHQHYAS
jgi:hypothetical protein